MRVLVTGNLGYIGTVLTDALKKKGYEVVGLDTNYYDGFKGLSYREADSQILKDIRDVTNDDLYKIDAIIHLAALSNDPLGEFNPQLTEDINLHATIKLAKLAKAEGVKRFVYSSSQSMYGLSNSEAELDEDKSEKNPLTVYARTKWLAECELRNLASDHFVLTYFRPSTVFGASPKLRCDIVFNNFVACAYTTGKIEIKSDGTPWRPVVHVRDVCQAYIAGLEAPKELINNQAFNVGIPNGNFSVRDLAEAAGSVIPGSKIIYSGEHPDSRSYRVSFRKILSVLKDYFKPEWDLIKGGRELIELFEEVKFTERDFLGVKCNRLNQLRDLIRNNDLDHQLRRRQIGKD